MDRIDKLGPFDIKSVTREMVASVVVDQGMPMIATETRDGKTDYAVIAKDKGLRIVCAGCFRDGMTLADDSRTKKCASFVKHWDTKDGHRRLKCKESDISKVAANCPRITVADGMADGVVTLKDASNDEILKEVVERGLEDVVAEGMDGQLFETVMIRKGITPLIDARPTRLIHELRRQARDVSEYGYYHSGKKRSLPHCSDEVGVDILEEREVVTRQTKKHKFIKTRFLPKSVTNFIVDQLESVEE